MRKTTPFFLFVIFLFFHSGESVFSEETLMDKLQAGDKDLVIEKLLEQKQYLKERLYERLNEKEALSREIPSLKKKIENYEQDLTIRDTNIDSMEAKIKGFNESLELLKRENNELESINHTLRDKLKDWQLDFEDRVQSLKETYLDEVDDLQIDVSDLSSELRKKEFLVENFEHREKKLNEKILFLKENRRKLLDSMDGMEIRNQQLKEEMLILSSDYDNMQEEIDQLLDSNDAQGEVILNLKKGFSEKETDLWKRVEETQSEAEKKVQEMEQAHLKEKKSSKEEIVSLQKELSVLMEVNEREMGELRKKEFLVENFKQREKELNEKVLFLKENRRKLLDGMDGMEIRNQQLAEEILALSSDYEDAQEEVDELLESNDVQGEMILNLEKDVLRKEMDSKNKIEETIAKAEKRVEGLEQTYLKERKLFENKISGLKKKFSGHNKMQKRIDALLKNNDRKEDEIFVLKKDILGVKESSQRKIEDIKVKAAKKVQEIEQVRSQEKKLSKEEIVRLQKELSVLKEVNEREMGELTQLQKKEKRLGEDYAILIAEKESLEGKMVEGQSCLAENIASNKVSLKKKNAELEETLEQLRGDLVKGQGDIQNFKEKIENFSKEKKLLTEKSQSLSEELNEVRRQKSKEEKLSQQKIKKLERKYGVQAENLQTTLDAQTEKLKKQTVLFDEAKRSKEFYAQEYHNFNETKKGLQGQILYFSKQVKELESTLELKEKNLLHAQDLERQVKNELSEIQKDKEILDEELLLSQQKWSDKENVYERSLLEAKASLESKVNALEVELIEKEEVFKETELQLTKGKENLALKLEVAQDEIIAKSQRLTALMKQQDILKMDFGLMTIEKEELSQKLISTQELLKEMEEFMTAKVEQAKVPLKENIQQLEKKLTTYESQISNFRMGNIPSLDDIAVVDE